MREGATTEAKVGVKPRMIVAFRGERGSYNGKLGVAIEGQIVAFRGERGSYNVVVVVPADGSDCSFPG